MACVDENALTAYFAFRLTSEETTRLFDHLDGCSACSQLFNDIAAALTSQKSMPTLPERDGRAAAPPTLGRYQIDRILGMGGMGVVYAGWDPQLERKVAIKLLQPDSKISAGTLRARLMREAQAMAKLSHPNVINVFEVGALGEQVFVVMELIDGMTLAAWLAEKERSWREIVAAFVAAGSGLEAAHKAGIIHRDFKPDNVLVGKDGRICVTDFGLARRAEVAEETATPSPVSPIDATLTRSGLLVGTPAYMAPEQMRGEPTDQRTDVFSFCIALYEALYGTRPFVGKTLDDLRAAIESGKVEPPRRGGAPGRLRRTIGRGLRSLPSERPASMAPLLRELQRDPARRVLHAAGWSAVILLSVLVLVGWQRSRRQSLVCKGAERKLAGIWDPSVKGALRAALSGGSAKSVADAIERALDGYTREWVTDHERVCEATRLRGEQSEAVLDLRMSCLQDRLDEVGALTAALEHADERMLSRALDATLALSSPADCTNADVAQLGVPEPADAQLRGQVRQLKRRLADAVTAGSLDKSAEALDIATEVATAPAAKSFLTLQAEALAERGWELSKLARTDEATRTLKQAAQAAVQSHSDMLLATIWIDLAFHLGASVERHPEAMEYAELAEAMIVRLGSPAALEIRLLQALCIAKRSNVTLLGECEPEYRRSLELAEKLYPANDPRLAGDLGKVAAVDVDKNRLGAAIELIDRARAIYEQDGLGETPKALNLLEELVIIHQRQERFEDVAAVSKRILSVYEKNYPANHPRILQVLIDLGDALTHVDRFDEADPVLERAQRLAVERRKELPYALPQVESLRGDVKVHRWRASHASGDLDESIRLFEAALADPALDQPVDLGCVQLHLARALWDGNRDRARARSLAIDAKAKLTKDPRDPTSLREVTEWLNAHASG